MIKHLNDLPQVYNKFKVLTQTLVDHEHATIKALFLNPNQAIPQHQFPLDVTFFILEGSGTITIDGKVMAVKARDVVTCPQNQVMSVKASETSSLYFLNIKTPGLKSLQK